MSSQNERGEVPAREQVGTRLRTLTRVALFATTGATVAIGIVVAREHPGVSGASSSSGSGTATSPSSGSTGNGGSSSTDDTGNTGSSSFAPSISSQAPSVTSGGSSR